MNRPMCRPCSWGSPQNTGSFAPSTMSGDTGTDFCSVFCSGPLRLTSQTPTQIAIQLSMIVVITSLAPVVAFSRPAMPPHTRSRRARPDHADHDVRQRRHRVERRAEPDGHVGADEVLALAADVEQAAAERERDRQAGEDQRRRDDQRLLEVEGGDDAVVLADPREEPVQPGAVEDRPVGRDRVLARERDDEAADREGQQRGQQRRDDAAAAQVAREPAGDRHRRALAGRLRRRCERGVVVLGALTPLSSSPRPPPVIATPKSSSLADGGSSATIAPS